MSYPSADRLLLSGRFHTMPDRLMGRYEVLSSLGNARSAEGGVWKVRDCVIDGQLLTLKVAVLSAEMVERAEALYREFDLLTKVEGPHLVPVRDLGWLTPLAQSKLLGDTGAHTNGEALFLTRDFVDGQPAVAWMAALSGDACLVGAARVVLAVAEALDALHAEGVVHGDVKAENVLVNGDPSAPLVALIDFGLGGFGRASSGGTPAWMAPEVWGARGGAAGDVYALGGLLYRMLGGQDADSSADPDNNAPHIGDIWEAHQRGGWRVWPPAVSQAPLGAHLIALAEHMLSVAQGDRPTARAVAQTLRTLQGFGEGARRMGFGGRWPFLGRERELGALWGWLRATDGLHVGVVHGPAGVGKTRLIEQLRWRLQRKQREQGDRSALFEVPRIGQSGGAWEGLQRLIAQMEANASTPSPEVPARGDGVTFEQQARRFSERITALVPKAGAVVLWDDFDASPPEAQRWLIWHLGWTVHQASASQGLRWLLGSTRPLEHSSAWGLPLEGLSWAEVEGWIRVHLQRLGLPSGWSGALANLWEPLGRSPMLLEAHGRGWLKLGYETRSLDMSSGIASYTDALSLGLGRVIESLSPDVLRVAAALTLFENPTSIQTMCDLLRLDPSTSQQALDALSAHGLTRRVGSDGRHWQLRWPILQNLLTSRLDRAQRAQMLSEAARYLSTRTEAERLRAFELRLQWLGNIDPPFEQDEQDNIDALKNTWRWAVDVWVGQGAWSRASARLFDAVQYAELRALPDLTERLVDISVRAGEAQRALQVLEPLQASDPNAKRLYARVLYAMGRPADAIQTLEPAPPASLDPFAQALWWLEMALAFVRVGPYERAASAAAAGLHVLTSLLQQPHQEAVLAVFARLRMIEAAAQLFLGSDGAAAALEAALPLLQKLPDAHRTSDLARLHSFRAMAYSRNGDHTRATDAYQEALVAAERAGLEYDLPLYLLNLGTAYHRRGLLGLALEYYAQGTRQSLPEHTRPSTLTLLLANQANVLITLGRVPHAEPLLDAAAQILQTQKLPTVEVFLQQLRADAAAARQDWPSALNHYQSAATLYAAQGDHWRQAEAFLKAADTLLRTNHPGLLAHELTNQALTLIERNGHGPRELRARLHITQSRLGLACNDPPLAHIHRWLEALREADRQADSLLILEHAPALADRLLAEGMREAEAEVVSLIHRSWNPLAAALTADQRRDLLSRLGQPLSRTPHTNEHHTLPHTNEHHTHNTNIIEQFYKLLSLNARLLNEPQLNRLLPAAMDIALALSGAERGFVLLRDPSNDGGFKVAISRDVDGEPITRPHLKVSLTIARRVAESGEQVVTVNAQDDTRFSAALSVHRLELTSVLCVPICDRDQVLGTLYLDHRFRPDMFTDETPRMMRAFADQLALALVGAQRLQNLSNERESLKAARQQVEALLAEKEALLSDLNTRYQTLTREVEHKDATLRTRHQYANIVAASRRMQQVLSQLDRVVDSRIPVLILGDSGTGKELVARAIHFNGPRALKPFIAFNCGAVSEALAESELFGHTKGAFTGADRARDGLFVAADGGTLFLDELGEMPLAIQVKLLRALQEKRIRPVGATQEREVDVRVVAATNRNLQDEVAQGRFREDLYWRLAAFSVTLPQLSERREDIPHLIRHLLRRFAEDEGLSERKINPEAMAHLYHLPWPGNVRQLENTLRTAAVFAASDEITLRDVRAVLEPDPTNVSPSFHSTPPPRPHTHPLGKTKNQPPARRGRRPQLELSQVQRALTQTNNDRRAAALRLGVSERTLYRYLLQLSPKSD
jgi:transcriptional regulator with GAF, ATPase, and Fis domain